MSTTRLPHVTYLEQADQQPQRQRGRVPVPLIAGVALLLVLVGAGVTWLLMRDPAATPAVTAAVATASPTAPVAVAPTMAVSTSVAVTDPGKLACERVAAAVAANSLDDLVALRAIGEQAGASKDLGVSLRGLLLRDGAADAAAASGDQAVKLKAKAAQSARDLQTACVKAGYRN